jgi:hypothetical protein
MIYAMRSAKVLGRFFVGGLVLALAHCGSDSIALAPTDASVPDGALNPIEAGDAGSSTPDGAPGFVNPKGHVSGPIDALIAGMQVGEWKTLQNTAMSEVCPRASDGSSAHYQCEAVVSAWGGAAFDTSRDRLLVNGGGHADSWLNNVFEFDLATMKWARVSEGPAGIATSLGTPTGLPSYMTDTFYEPCGYYPTGTFPIKEEWRGVNAADPVFARQFIKRELCELPEIRTQLDYQQPRSVHTYGNLAYVPAFDSLCHTGMAATFISGQASSYEMVCFDLSVRRWGRQGSNPFIAYNRSAVDARGDVWYQGTYALTKYNMASKVFEKKYENDIYSLTGDAADIDRKRDMYVAYQVATNRLSAQSTQTGAKDALAPGPSATVRTSPGFVYVDHQDAFYLWNTSREMWKLNPSTKAWTAVASTGDDPGAAAANGTFGRFRYSSNRKVLVLLNSTKTNVSIFKLAP